MKPFKIAVSPGHTPSAPGATHGNITEYGLSMAVLGDLVFRLDKLGHQAWIIGAESNTMQARKINKMNPDFGFELHFNAHKNREVCGTEVLHSGSNKGQALASDLENSITNILGTKSRGIPIGHYQLNPKKPLITIIRKTVCPMVVVEPLFLSNPDDFEKIDITLISVGILRGLEAYWEGL